MQPSHEQIKTLEGLCRLVRSFILESTHRAGSGHPSSCLSAVELMVSLFFGGTLHFDCEHPEHPNNDRVLFSKGHAAPLLYALYAAAGKISETEMLSLRTFGSPLEGHPTPAFRFTEAATGSLGQGLSIGLGMALNARYLDRLPYTTWVLLGDSEMSEGSQWEAIQLASHYRLDNLVGIVDVNRLGQRGETMYGHDLEAYRSRLEAFGWEVFSVDGHSLSEIATAYSKAEHVLEKPVAILARTIKGKGVPGVEDRNGRHGKAVKGEEYKAALQGLEDTDPSLRGNILLPEDLHPEVEPASIETTLPIFEKPVSTREAYGKALCTLCARRPELVCLDGEVSNSTHAAEVKECFPERFFEMYVAEQNMLGAALGLSLRGKIPFVSTFAAFFTRAFDQLRMARYSGDNLKCAGSHAGVSIGEDGPSQMGLEDLSLFRSLYNSVVLYPCDGPSTAGLVESAAAHEGLVYLRLTRGKTPLIYGPEESFPIGGSKVLRQSPADVFTLCAAGITLHEALAAADRLEEQGSTVRVIDLYSVKPIDHETLVWAGSETRGILVLEDHYPEGGLFEAVAATLSTTSIPVHSLAVRRRPMSGKPDELMDYEGISRRGIVEAIEKILS